MINGYWVHNLDPFIFRFSENMGLRWYGAAYIFGFVAAYALLTLYYKKGRSPLNGAQIESAVIAIILGVMLGGRLGFVLFYALDYFPSDPWFVFRVWEGGMSSHGGFIGVILAAWWISYSSRIPVVQLLDLLASVTSFGLFFGRIANFINGELWGRISDVPWAVIFPESGRGLPLESIAPRHPSQLYEALGEGLLLIVFCQWRLWKTQVLRTPGRLAGEFVILYALIRIFCELFREPDAALILGMSRGMFYSLFMILGGVWLWKTSGRRKTVGINF